jgi:hypothetical protein
LRHSARLSAGGEKKAGRVCVFGPTLLESWIVGSESHGYY